MLLCFQMSQCSVQTHLSKITSVSEAKIEEIKTSLQNCGKGHFWIKKTLIELNSTDVDDRNE